MKSLMMSGGSEWVLKTKTILLASGEAMISRTIPNFKTFSITPSTFPATQKDIELVSVTLSTSYKNNTATSPFKKKTLPVTLGMPANPTSYGLQGRNKSLEDTSIIDTIWVGTGTTSASKSYSIHITYQCKEQE
ncbi:hypothetical protein [Campylobacter sp. FOBRC14]|jgi:hypothetical protein|uniref:hypothetical protein n=1 Tax=Campylobacter sp. FOBRC14 TaxID=936554 RepID=UPI00054E1FE1|nr:hypothetical protein [Campylobacter sp. FOBRC14]